jgi:hypothetical protein
LLCACSHFFLTSFGGLFTKEDDDDGAIKERQKKNRPTNAYVPYCNLSIHPHRLSKIIIIIHHIGMHLFRVDSARDVSTTATK